MEREVYKRIGKNDWTLVEMKDLKVSDIFSLHENGKFCGLFTAMGPPYLDNNGEWKIYVNRYAGE
jgi:hypothetical protein